MIITEIPAKLKEQKTVRVAAYARVSADKDAAFHSLEAQTEYYEKYVAAHLDWELTGLYSDNGISGTTVNRPEFQRMLEDCRYGKIDLVITKSITRFARNTVILLETIRELKKLASIATLRKRICIPSARTGSFYSRFSLCTPKKKLAPPAKIRSGAYGRGLKTASPGSVKCSAIVWSTANW